MLGEPDMLASIGEQFNHDYVVVMTACIDPGSKHPELHRRDPTIRKQDYQEALHFWITHPDSRLHKIVFVENTGYPLQELEKEAEAVNSQGKEIEFISLQCNDCPPGISYGYPELAMLDLAVPQSKLIQRSRYFIKTTGRLSFPALPTLLNRLPPDFLFAVDSRRYRLPASSPMAFTTTQLMIFSVGFYTDKLMGLREKMNTSIPFIEHLFYQELMKYQGLPGAILRWPVNVDPCGRAGHSAKNYNAPKQHVVNSIRAIFRVMLPSWWI